MTVDLFSSFLVLYMLACRDGSGIHCISGYGPYCQNFRHEISSHTLSYCTVQSTGIHLHLPDLTMSISGALCRESELVVAMFFFFSKV